MLLGKKLIVAAVLGIMIIATNYVSGKDKCSEWPQTSKLIDEIIITGLNRVRIGANGNIETEAAEKNMKRILFVIESFREKDLLIAEIGGNKFDNMNPIAISFMLSVYQNIISGVKENSMRNGMTMQDKRVVKVKCPYCTEKGVRGCMACNGTGYIEKVIDYNKERNKKAAEDAKKINAHLDIIKYAIIRYIEQSAIGNIVNYEKIDSLMLNAVNDIKKDQLNLRIDLYQFADKANGYDYKKSNPQVIAITPKTIEKSDTEINAKLLRLQANVLDLKEKLTNEENAANKLRIQASLLEANEDLKKYVEANK